MKNKVKFKGEKIKHPRKNMWGEVVIPSRAYGNFKSMRADGRYHPKYKWKQCCTAYRKKIRKMKIAKLSRKGLRKRIKCVR